MSDRTSTSQATSRRRGVIAVFTAISLIMMLAFCMLVIDGGNLYLVRAELQNSADAAALAAASQLLKSSGTSAVGDSTDVACTYAGMNKVLFEGPELENADIEIGHAEKIGERYYFQPGGDVPDAVRVTVRQTENSKNGAVPLFFGPLFGHNSANVAATAAARVIPRDIAIVADLSASHSDDSELKNFRNTEINIWDVWAGLPGGAPPEDDSYEQQAGPRPGHLMTLGWGDTDMDANYSPANDPGLAYLPPNQNWSNNALEAALAHVGYNTSEISAILSGSNDSRGGWNYRVAVATGLAVWRSGIDGGKWQADGVSAGDRDTRIESGELLWLDYPYEEGGWLDYVENYVGSSRTEMYDASSEFRYRYGAKTFVNYLLERKVGNAQTSALSGAPVQPMQAVKDGISLLTQVVTELDSGDLLSLESYDTTGHHEIDLTMSYGTIAQRIKSLQAGHYGSWTNMGAGIEKAVAELTSGRSRDAAIKYMFLLTDGRANVTKSGQTGDYNGGAAYALEAAELAAEKGIKIYCISVGSGADRDLMQQIASITGGKEYYATGSIAEYTAQLQAIFDELARLRPVVMIE